jgi:hypothetical protein
MLNEILCDIDLFYLGSDKYKVCADKLCSELKENSILKTKSILTE